MWDRVGVEEQQVIEVLLSLAAVSFVFTGFVPFAVAGAGIRFSWIIAALIVVFGGIRIFRERRLELPLPAVFLILLYGWMLLGGIGPLTSGNPVRAREFVFGLLRFGLFTSVAVVLASSGIGTRSVVRFLRMSVVTAVGVSLYAIYQFFARQYGLPFGVLEMNNPSLTHSLQFGSSYYTGGVFPRVTGTFPEPAWFGIYLIDIVAVLAILLLYGRSDLLFDSRKWSLAALSVVSIAFIVAFSLGAYGSIAILMGVFLLREVNVSSVRSHLPTTSIVPISCFAIFDLVAEQGQITVVILGRSLLIGGKAGAKLSAFAGGVASSFTGGGQSDANLGGEDSPSMTPTPTRTESPTPTRTESPTPTRTESPTPSPTETTTATPAQADRGIDTSELNRSSLEQRVVEAKEGFQVWLQEPITGVGINNLQFYIPSSFDSISFTYARILAEIGLIGMGVFLASVVTVLSRLYRRAKPARRGDSGTQNVLSVVFLYVLIGYLISAMVFLHVYHIRFWFFLGVGIAVSTGES